MVVVVVVGYLVSIPPTNGDIFVMPRILNQLSGCVSICCVRVLEVELSEIK